LKNSLNEQSIKSLLPEVDEENKTRRLNVEVNTALYKAMRYYCIANDKSISSITRELWLEFLKKRGFK